MEVSNVPLKKRIPDWSKSRTEMVTGVRVDSNAIYGRVQETQHPPSHSQWTLFMCLLLLNFQIGQAALTFWNAFLRTSFMNSTSS